MLTTNANVMQINAPVSGIYGEIND